MSIVDILADRAYKRIEGYDFEKLYAGGDVDFNSILQDLYRLLQVDKYYSYAVRMLCFVCDTVPNDPFTTSLLKSCINSSRIFLYESMLRSRGLEFDEREGLIEFSQKAFYSLESEVVLTKEQKDLYDTFMRKRRLVVSAPTSFGKSRIIREIISHSSYKNIMVVVPTNALLSETLFSFKSDSRLARYRMVFSTHIEPEDTCSIYIFTPEKFDVYTDEYEVSYDFFVFDEVYKVDGRDSRSSVFANCLYKAYRQNCDYYLIGPYFNGFSKVYLDRTRGLFKKFDTDIVQKFMSNYFSEQRISFLGKDLKAFKGKDTRLKHVLGRIDGQSIVYVSRKDSAETRAKHISSLKSEALEDNRIRELVNYVKINISEEWGLISYLERRVAFHHAGVPKYIQAEIVELFNAGLIDTLVCTPTLTEGVNTSAKNVIFYDTKKADIALSGFEVKNVIGRSGRFGQHFVGRAIFLEEHEAQDNINEINFPFFDYDIISDIDNMQIEYLDLNAEGRTQREEIVKKAEKLGVSVEVLKENKYIPFENQLNLIRYLRNNQELKYLLSVESGLPNKSQVDTLMFLIHEIFRI